MNPGAVLFPTMYEMLIGILKSWKYRGYIDNRLNGWRRRRRWRSRRKAWVERPHRKNSFVHCPNSNWTHPPALKRALCGTYFGAQSNHCHVLLKESFLTLIESLPPTFTAQPLGWISRVREEKNHRYGPVPDIWVDHKCQKIELYFERQKILKVRWTHWWTKTEML